jgi:hypothetical protein
MAAATTDTRGSAMAASIAIPPNATKTIEAMKNRSRARRPTKAPISTVTATMLISSTGLSLVPNSDIAHSLTWAGT